MWVSYVGTEVHAPARSAGGTDVGEQSPAEHVVAFQLGAGERHDLGQEPVDPHEPLEHVTEPVTLFLVQGVHPVDGGSQRSVDPSVIGCARHVEQQADDLDGLVGAQDPELVQCGSGVV